MARAGGLLRHISGLCLDSDETFAEGKILISAQGVKFLLNL
jgi:hypothetical protein